MLLLQLTGEPRLAERTGPLPPPPLLATAMLPFDPPSLVFCICQTAAMPTTPLSAAPTPSVSTTFYFFAFKGIYMRLVNSPQQPVYGRCVDGQTGCRQQQPQRWVPTLSSQGQS